MSAGRKKINYYNVAADVAKYPKAWLYIAIGGRARGKTYGALLDCKDHIADRDFIFIKRTMDDVDLLCSGSGNVNSTVRDVGVNVSPFAAINRDTGSDIRAYSIRKGMAGFWQTEIGEDGKLQPVGAPIGTIFALNAVTKYKGFEMASAKKEQWIIFDEFIPNLYDRVNVNEGKQLLDFYKTVSRDRVQRGLEEIKLICLANSTNIANPVFNELELTDLVAEMVNTGTYKYYDPDRLIFIHLLEDDPAFIEIEADTGLYKAMHDTQWGEMTYNNKFAYNDFSNVKRQALKNYRCVCGYKYHRTTVYIYYNEGKYFFTKSRSAAPVRIYDLQRENEQKAFWRDWMMDLRIACINDNVYFAQYSFYNLLANYKQLFRL